MLRRLAFLAPLLVASTAFAAPPPLPSPSGASGAGTTATPTPAIDFDALRKGVVQVEQSVRPIAIANRMQNVGVGTAVDSSQAWNAHAWDVK